MLQRSRWLLAGGACIVAAMLIGGMLAFVPFAHAKGGACHGAYDVKTHLCSATIQAAVNNAQPGDTILVAPGHYNENVVIPAGKDGLSLLSREGANATQIEGVAAGPNVPYSAIIDIAANNVTLGGPEAGFTLRYGTDVASQTQIFGVNIGSNGNSGTLSGDTVENNIIENLDSTGSPLPQFGRVVGIAITESANTHIRGNHLNTISFMTGPTMVDVFGYGILFYGSNTNATVTDNVVRDLSETGGASCPGEGALGISINDQMNGATVTENRVSDVQSTCLAVGISSSATAGTIRITDNTVSQVSSTLTLRIG